MPVITDIYKNGNTYGNYGIASAEYIIPLKIFMEHCVSFSVEMRKNSHNIISGTKIGLEPKGTATRAQIAVILQAFDKNIKNK